MLLLSIIANILMITMELYMSNDDLKSLVTKMYDNVLNLIDQEDSTTKNQLVNYLKDAIKIVESIEDDDVNSTKQFFTNQYREIAHKSISSYKNSNGKFEKLSKMQEETLIVASKEQIDLPSITKKFDEIQIHMSEEVGKANDIITKLSSQVKELEKTSNIDALTKILNRRSLNNYLNDICNDKEKEYEFHLLMLDIDDFKQINDNFGHIAGDKVLIYISNIIKKTLRGEDKIFRYGGEEFIIILNGVDDIKCFTITNRILELVRNSKLIYKGDNLSVTTSIGTTKFLNSDTPETLIARADQALYKAKKSGKDKICSEI